MNIRNYQASDSLYWDLAKAVRRAARAARISQKLLGHDHRRTLTLQKRAEAYAQALLAAKAERKEKRGRR